VSDRPENLLGLGRRASKRALSDLVLAAVDEPDEHGRRKPESLYGSLKT
jgi:hypothetical protein